MTTALSVATLFAERDAVRQRDKQAEEQLHRQREEELVEFRQRLDNFKLTGFCTDNGRAIINAGVPPINKPSKEEVARQAEQPDWLITLPSGVHQVLTTGRPT